MALQLTNSLTGKKEPFEPLVPGEVSLYVCGPTVYNFIHIGNARVAVFYDVVHRFLEYLGFKVTRVVNYTDVDDKIIQKAREEKKTSLEVSERYVQEFETDLKLLGIRRPTRTPKVTEHIPQIIQFIEGLIKNGMAYAVDDGEVFYSVRNFKEYGKLSKKNLDDLRVGVRVQPGELKRDPLDFSLWKPQKNADEPAWDSPWGKGRPGWHIECSAMAKAYLGETFDIHGGGMDLIHPHHENEIAQTEGLTKKPFVRYWVHSNMLTFNAEKMSKSLGNIMLVREFIGLYGAETLKFFLLSGHYRSTIDYSEKHIRESQAALHRIYSAKKKCETFASFQANSNAAPLSDEKHLLEIQKQFEPQWRAAMEDDLNTAKLLGFIFDYVRALNTYLDKKGFKPSLYTTQIAKGFIAELEKLNSVLNIFGLASDSFLNDLKEKHLKLVGLTSDQIQQAITQRSEARAKKDFATSDKIRDEMLAKGIELRDRGTITEWDLIFSA